MRFYFWLGTLASAFVLPAQAAFQIIDPQGAIPQATAFLGQPSLSRVSVSAIKWTGRVSTARFKGQRSLFPSHRYSITSRENRRESSHDAESHW